MWGPRLIHTAAFRLALLYAALFAAGAILLVAFFDLAVAHYAKSDLREELAAEEKLLLATTPGRTPDAAARLVAERQHVLGDREFLYLVLDGRGRRLAGDLPRSAARLGRGEVRVPAPVEEREEADETAEIHTWGAPLAGGGLLVVGRSSYEYHELRETLQRASLAAAGLISLMSLGIALIIGRQFLSRIDRVNAAAARIMDGRIEERLPAIGMGDEFDRLAANLNSMLDRIQELMEGLRQVSSDIAHDLRTPLMRLRRRLEAALEVQDDPARRELALEETLDQVDELLATFGALLRIAQVEGGTGREAFRRIDVSELMEQVLEVYEPAAEDAGKPLQADIEGELAMSGDRELVTQLVSNLLENALSHTPARTPVTLRAFAEAGRVVMAVADRGPGIPAVEREKVLRRFYRLDRSRTTPGAGLGLSMARAIVQLHGGELALTDNAPGLVVRASFPQAPTQD
jgi:signal transduction histidine kinase